MRLLRTLVVWLVCVIFWAILAAVLATGKEAGTTDVILSAGFAILFYLRLFDDIDEYDVNLSDVPSPMQNMLGFIKGLSFYIFTFTVLCVPIIVIKWNFAEYYIYLTMILLMLNIFLSMIPSKPKVKRR